MIKSFKSPETGSLFADCSVTRYRAIERPARRKLMYLHRARVLQDLSVPPGNRLESLKGDRRGQYRIRINERRRICFPWHEGNAYDVDIVDHH